LRIVYGYIENEKLFIIKWTGEWDLVAYKNSMNDFINFIKSSEVEKVIQDISDLNFDIKMLDFEELVKLRKEKITKIYKTVYITKKPQDVVFSHLYLMEFLDKDSMMYCSTTEKAIELLSLSISDFDLKNKILNLEEDI